ncbi:MAG: hydantoinase/oxoprolinase family protein, partial [Rhodospirillaceae bacterium]
MTDAPSGRIVGVDVGGTFSDLIMLDQSGGGVRLAKVPSTPENQAFGVLAALDAAEADLAALDLIVHGTTTTTNAVLERKLSRTGLITTQGFRDILELGRRTRPQAYGMVGTFTPVIPRDLRLEVPERMDAAGEVVTALGEAAVRAAAQKLLDAGCEAVVDELKGRGYAGEVLVMNGNGGMVSSADVAREAVKTVMSGPASGVMAAAYTGRQAGLGNLLTYDMGGTSTDVALIRGAQPAVSNEIEVEYAMPIHVPMVDVRTVGAGGGSIARVNAGGLLEVGPESAGADPGPICYGRGGKQPTISDANLLLGRLNPAGFKSLQASSATDEVAAVFQRELGDPLGLDATQAAAAVVRIANTKMAGAIRMVSLSLGMDPRDFALFAFGGAGPLHATALARELGVPRVVIPGRPGITNALGCIVADLRHDFINTVNRSLDAVDMDAVHALFAQQTAEGERLIAKEPIAVSEIRRLYSVDMQFVGQTHLLRVELDGPAPSRDDLRLRFEAAYFKRFRVELADIRANLVNVNT